MSELAVMDKSGDTKTIWDKDNPAEVEAARAMFDKLKGEKKYIAYSVKADGKKGEVMQAFDAAAEKIIMAPPMVGG